MYNFTPVSAMLGGLIIGVSVVLFFYTTGRMAGISGIFANTVTTKTNRSANFLFLLGLVVGPLIYFYTTKVPANFKITDSLVLIIIGGLLVGLGTRMCGGCTSGHGICGISRVSISSMVATITFIITGMITVFILQQFGIYK